MCGYHIRPLPVEFSLLPHQALYITIHKGPLSSSPFSLPSDFIGSTVNVRVVTCNAPNTFEVTVPESKKCKLPGTCVQECDNLFQEIHIKVNLPDIKLPFQAVVAHVNTVTDFYVHQLDRESAERMRKLETDMQLFYSNRINHHFINKNELLPGNLCCVYSVIHELYCRAVLLHMEGNLMCKVQLFDYGHTEMMSLQDLLVLPINFLHLPLCSIHCRLVFQEEELPNDVIEELTTLFKPMATSLKVYRVVQGKSKFYMLQKKQGSQHMPLGLLVTGALTTLSHDSKSLSLPYTPSLIRLTSF